MTGDKNQLNEPEKDTPVEEEHVQPGPDEQIKLLKKEREECARLAQERLSSLKYLQADFDNYRKQFEKQKVSIVDHANEKLILDLLVILDDFEHAVSQLKDEKTKEGISMISKKMVKILSDYGLQPVESVGKKFDPLYHEVLCTEPCGATEDGIVLEEIAKGYMLKSKVIRPAKVKIARNKSDTIGEGGIYG